MRFYSLCPKVFISCCFLIFFVVFVVVPSLYTNSMSNTTIGKIIHTLPKPVSNKDEMEQELSV